MKRIDKNDPNYTLRKATDGLVWDIFSDRIYHGVITISREEMVNVIINLLAEFLKFQGYNSKLKQPTDRKGEKE